MNIRYDGKDYDLSDAAQKAAFDAAVKAHDEANAAALAAEKTRADKAEARADAAVAELAPLKAEKAAAARNALEARARKVLDPESKFDGLTDRQVMERALTAAKIDVTGKTDDYVTARFDSLAESVVGSPGASVDNAAKAAFLALQPAGPPRTVASEPKPNALTERWKEPLTRSKQDRK